MSSNGGLKQDNTTKTENKAHLYDTYYFNVIKAHLRHNDLKYPHTFL